MSDIKRQYRFRISDDLYDYLIKYAIDNNLARESPSLALEEIVEFHKKNSQLKLDTENIANTVTNNLNKTILKELNKVRLGTNSADRNTQILIELIQGFMQAQNIKGIFTTEMNKPDYLEQVEALIQKRISELKQRKHDNHKK